jgi:mannose-1-phosphate guanylyltransferase
LTEHVPKPLLPFGDRPLVEYAFAALRAAGVPSPFVLNVHHLAHEFERRRAGFSSAVRLVHEPEIRGTAGGIAGARAELGSGPVLVLLGDVVIEQLPRAFVERAAQPGIRLLIAERAAGQGTVGLDDAGHVVRLRGERFGVETRGGEYLGCATLSAADVASLPSTGCLIGDVVLPLLRQGTPVRGFDYAARFVLPGDDLRGFWASNLAWLAQRGKRVSIGPNVSIATGVELDQVVIGEGAKVTGRGGLERVVVMPGAQVSAPLSSALVGFAGEVIPLSSPF